MKRKNVQKLVGGLILITCLSCTGCTGVLQPKIGESSTGSAADLTMGEERTIETEGAEEGIEQPDIFMFAEAESEPRPEMVGNVVKKFEVLQECEDARGGIELLTATVELYDAENAEGNTALISVVLGETATYTACIWSETNGHYVLKLDEFTNYESKEIEGVTMITGIRYDFGMSGKGNIDIPEVDEKEIMTNNTVQESERIMENVSEDETMQDFEMTETDTEHIE